MGQSLTDDELIQENILHRTKNPGFEYDQALQKLETIFATRKQLNIYKKIFDTREEINQMFNQVVNDKYTIYKHILRRRLAISTFSILFPMSLLAIIYTIKVERMKRFLNRLASQMEFIELSNTVNQRNMKKKLNEKKKVEMVTTVNRKNMKKKLNEKKKTGMLTNTVNRKGMKKNSMKRKKMDWLDLQSVEIKQMKT